MFWKKDSFATFIESVQSIDFEEYGTFLLTKVKGDDRSISLVCQIKIDDNETFHGTWLISCEGVKKSRLRMGYFDRIYTADDHILLTEYTEPVFRLGFRGKVENTSCVVGALYECHRSLADDWIPLSAFLMGRKVNELIHGGFGTFAEGPARFINAYKDVLEYHGFETSLSGERRPTEWRGSGRKEFPALHLLILDESFVAAEAFNARKI